MSDVADMLGLSAKPSSGNLALEEAQKIMGDKVKVKGMKKPKGMSREVYDLLGKDGLVPATQGNVIAPNFKSKRVNALKGKWIWTHIVSSARQNNQPAFFHWIRAEQAYSDYPYASFNVKLDTFSYSEEEYAQFLDTPDWTKADTDELVRVCHQFDMRWAIIADRIILSKSRAVEDMQDRYYTVRSTLQNKRAEQAGLTVVGSGAGSGFNVEQERKRRRAQDMLFKKTKEDEVEETQLREELKAIDAALKKNKKVKTSTAEAAAAPPVPAGTIPPSALLGPGMLPRTILAAPGAAGIADPAAAAAAGRSVPAAAMVTGPAPGRPCLQSSRLYSGTVPPLNLTGSLTECGVTKLDVGQTNGTLSKKMLTKMTMYLRELEIPENPLPTKAVCDLVEQIKLSTVTLLSLHNCIARKEKELAQLQSGSVEAAAGAESKSKASRSVKKETDKASVGQSEDASSTGAQGAEVAAEAAAEAGVWVKAEAGSEGGDDQSSSSSAVCMDVVEEG